MIDNLPNDGYAYYHISNQKLLNDIKIYTDVINIAIKKRWNIIQKYTNTFIPGKINEVTSHSNLSYICDWTVIISRKDWSTISNKIKEFNSLQKRQNKINVLYHYNKKSKLHVKISIHGKNNIFKEIRSIKCYDSVNDALSKFLEDNSVKLYCVIDRNIMKIVHLDHIYDLWFMKVPLNQNTKLDNVKMPKGIKRLKLSQYWSMIEKKSLSM